MAKIIAGTNRNKNNIGIHLFDPTKQQVADAREDAVNKDFPFVYVHRTRQTIVNKRR